MVTCSLSELPSTVETKFSVRKPYMIKLFLAEVDDYIEWDKESELMVASEPSSKIWKIIVEK